MPLNKSIDVAPVEAWAERSAGASARIPVVAIGAAAGGLAATRELVRHLGPRPGVAIVLIHHSDPLHSAGLGELIQGVTPLPVRAASDGLRVEVNQIYVGPQDAIVGVEGGVLRLEPCTVTAGHHHPIDRLFESLAVDRTVQALGVVLTGTGSDGTAGIQAMKINGGVTFAQDGSAEHRDMPESAIATGCVDFILAPDDVARELIRIGARESAPAPFAADERAFQRILKVLRDASAIDFANYKQTTFRRRVERRVLVNGAHSLAAYAELVERSPEEARALCDEALINVTSFFRDPETFEALGKTVFPKLLENRPRNAALRIWVPGCSTGEEVYSLAIALLEFLGDARAEGVPIKLFGTDVSASSIDKARSGRYPAGIARDVSPGRLQRFFTNHHGVFHICKEVRDLCVFGKHDATRDPPFAGMDLISCRNLMIYLGTPLQDRIVPIFHYALREPGFLVLGHLETLRAFSGFTSVDAKNHIYARSSASPPTLRHFGERRRPDLGASEMPSGIQASLPQDVKREVDRLVLAEFAPPGVVVTEDLAIVQFRGRTGPFLEPSSGVASFDLMRMVRDELRLPLRQTIDEARTAQNNARRAVSLSGPGARDLLLEVIPLRVASTAQRLFLVLFRDAVSRPPAEAIGPAGPLDRRLTQELAATRDYVQSVIEQLEATNEELQAANEEIVSSNEELRSTNEELQMAKRELQATNEELGKTNDEMEARNQDATRLNEDLTNVLTSVAIPIVMLGRDSRLRRFTPAAAKLFGLGAGDVGRPFGEVKAIFSLPALGPSIAQVLQDLTPVDRMVQDQSGRWFQVRVLPYFTLDKRIDGTVVVAVDIDAVKKGELLLRDYRDKLRQTVHDSALAEERERRRIAVEVHDHIGQALALAQIKLTSIREAIPGPASVAFDQAVDLLVQSIADTRTLIFDLSPPVLYDLGLEQAFSWLVEDLQKRHGLAIELTDDGADKPLPDATAAMVFRAVREILINVFKHARSPSARVALRRADGHYSIDVEDRGVGFDPHEIDRGQAGSGFGLFSVREQIERLGGTVEIVSSPGRGTRVKLRVPIRDHRPPSVDGSPP